LGRKADFVQGAYSILLGIAANKSMAEERDIKIKELINGLPEPQFAPLNGGDKHIPFVNSSKRMVHGKLIEANIPRQLSAPE
jgi:hypothetical protein